MYLYLDHQDFQYARRFLNAIIVINNPENIAKESPHENLENRKISENIVFPGKIGTPYKFTHTTQHREIGPKYHIISLPPHPSHKFSKIFVFGLFFNTKAFV